jgi:hypothetical protein
MGFDPSTDKDFLAATPEQQHAYLADQDQDYASANPAEQAQYRQYVTGAKAPKIAVNSLNVPKPKLDMKMDPGGVEPGGMPGVSEGAGLAGGLSEYDKSVAQGVGGGAKDIAHGNIAKGAHEVIGGVGSALTPILPLTVPAAPLATLGAFGGGQAGGYLANKGATALGATPDQAALAGDVGNIAGGIAGGTLGHYGQRSLPGPTFARAKTGFQEVAKATNPEVIDTSVPGNTALEIQKMAQAGGSQPKVIRDFVSRVTDPKKGPLTFEEARKFYTNASRLSADESQRLTPDMKRMVGQFRADLDQALTKAAATKGKAPQYTQAMKDYHRASKGADTLDTLKEYGKKAAITGAIGGGVGGGYGLYKALTK